jgi:hypothetical protein
MAAFLFSWNPKPRTGGANYAWYNFLEQLERGDGATCDWSCSNHKDVSVGDNAFMVKVGKKPRGVIGSGVIIRTPYEAQHWAEGREHETDWYVDIVWKHAFDPDESLLRLEDIPSGTDELGMIDKFWTPLKPGILIPDWRLAELEPLWNEFVARKSGENRVDTVITADDRLAEEQGYASGPKRLAMEAYSLKFVTDRIDPRWKVRDKHLTESYDLELRRSEETMFVEVKCATGDGNVVFLTENEVRRTTKDGDHTALVVVHGVRVDALNVVTGGRTRIQFPFHPATFPLLPDESNLTAFQYRYTVQDSDSPPWFLEDGPSVSFKSHQ